MWETPNEPAATSDPPVVSNERYDDEAEPTEREERLREEIEDIERGGPEKYRDRLEEQGKLFVRDRLELWFGSEGDGDDSEDVLLFEDGKVRQLRRVARECRRLRPGRPASG